MLLLPRFFIKTYDTHILMYARGSRKRRFWCAKFCGERPAPDRARCALASAISLMCILFVMLNEDGRLRILLQMAPTILLSLSHIHPKCGRHLLVKR
jgi:hypothetical protein